MCLSVVLMLGTFGIVLWPGWKTDCILSYLYNVCHFPSWVAYGLRLLFQHSSVCHALQFSQVQPQKERFSAECFIKITCYFASKFAKTFDVAVVVLHVLQRQDQQLWYSLPKFSVSCCKNTGLFRNCNSKGLGLFFSFLFDTISSSFP